MLTKPQIDKIGEGGMLQWITGFGIRLNSMNFGSLTSEIYNLQCIAYSF